MPKKADLEYFRAKGLLPFQAEFALSFLESDEENYWELVLPVSTGKTRVGVALVGHELEEDLNKRILVLAPSSLLEHWKYEISSFLSTTEPPYIPLIVGRKTYLELESKAPVDRSPWPVPSIILMSIDLAKRDDMVSSLKSVTWDLIIFDESHLLSKGKRKTLFEKLRESSAAHRALLLTASPQYLENVVTKVANWDVVDWDGRPLFPSFLKKLTPIHYERTKKEREFLKELQDFASQLGKSFSYGKLQEKLILRTAASSIYAIESMLRRLQNGWTHMRNKIAHDVPWTYEDLESVQQQLTRLVDEPGVIEELPEGATINPREFLALYQKLESLLNLIEEIPTDSKLDALISYIREFFEINKKRFLCIWCTFANTVEYVNSSIQDLGKPIFSITGAIHPLERMDILETFSKDGGILIVTDAASEGVALEYIDECINYDLPVNQQVFEQRWGRFLRLGRKSDFRMVILKDQSKALLWEEEVLKTLEDTVYSEEHVRE